jgi:lipoprotein-anchoring transpeptidase ErfK/SrfK
VVRLARRQARPVGIPAEARWVHVDLAEQVLTAYEGDRFVYATLVSTGKKQWKTPRGLFRVWLKVRHGTMDGRLEPYHVEEVPHAMFFKGGAALHGAFWHDQFGFPVSHGCINLAPIDADWLFGWAPPELPGGWHSVLPLAAGLESLWVWVS